MQLFDPAVTEWLSSSNDSSALALWPSPQLGGQPIPRQRVPADVLAGAELWITRIVRQEWRPTDIAEHLLPFDNFRESDVLADRYRINGWIIQIVELLNQVCITILPPENLRLQTNLTKESGEEYLTSLLEVTNFPLERRPEVAWTSSLVSVPNRSAIVSAGSKLAPQGVDFDSLVWWQVIHAWTDGSVGSFMFLKKTGSRPEALGATEQRIGDKRFRDSE